jgi:hypothetical protein
MIPPKKSPKDKNSHQTSQKNLSCHQILSTNKNEDGKKSGCEEDCKKGSVENSKGEKGSETLKKGEIRMIQRFQKI